MKLEWNRKFTTIAVYALLVLIGAILFSAIIFNLPTFWQSLRKLAGPLIPVVYGFAIAYILNPVVRAVERSLVSLLFRKSKASDRLVRTCSLAVTYLLLILLLLTFFWLVIPQIIASITDIASRLPGYVQVAEKEARSLFESLPQDVIPPEAIDLAVNSVQDVLNALYQMLSRSIPAIINYTANLASGVFRFAMGIVISFYFLADKERFFAQIKKLMYALLPKDTVRDVIGVARQSHITFSNFITGKLLDSLIIGVLCFAGVSVLKMPDVVLISVLVGVTNVIPYFGPFLGAIPSFLIIFIQNPVQAWVFSLFILALQQIDGNIIGPRILGASIGLPAFWVLFSILLFGSLLGVLGMFIGVPTFAVLYWLVRTGAEYRLREKNMPTLTADYFAEAQRTDKR